MKKIILPILVLVFSTIVYASEKSRYIVTIDVVYNYVYYSNGQEIGREIGSTETYTFTICAWGTGDAVREAGGMIDRNLKKYIGTDYYNGERCSKYLEYGYSANGTAEKQGPC